MTAPRISQQMRDSLSHGADKPELLAEMLRLLLPTDQARLQAIQVLRAYFEEACDGFNTFDKLDAAVEALEEKIRDLPDNQRALAALLEEEWQVGREVDVYGDEATIVGFDHEQGCVIVAFEGEEEKHFPASMFTRKLTQHPDGWPDLHEHAN